MNLTEIVLFRQAALLITTPLCFDVYFQNFDFLNGPCFSATLSKTLGLGIILGSILVKLPQIIKIYKNKSGVGISVLSVSADLTAITIMATYSYRKQFPFSAWGDTAFLGVQTVIIAVLVLYYADAIALSILYFVAFVAILTFMSSELLPLHYLWILQGCNIGIVLVGKMIQAWTNYKNGHTGNLSAVTWFMLLAGSMARIFTSIQETGDKMVILLYISSTCANALLVAQLLYYWNVKIEKKKTE